MKPKVGAALHSRGGCKRQDSRERFVFELLGGIRKAHWNRQCSAAVQRGQENYLEYMNKWAREKNAVPPRSGPVTMDQFVALASIYSASIGWFEAFKTPEFDGVFIHVPPDAAFRKRALEFSMYHHFLHSLIWTSFGISEKALSQVAENFGIAMMLAGFIKEKSEFDGFQKLFANRMSQYGECLKNQKAAVTPALLMAEILAGQLFDDGDSLRKSRFKIALSSNLAASVADLKTMYSRFQLKAA
ncbi:MAG: hypothetical protein HY552_01975 [Elusimicrobia bacterium]|nr:hypothetical protein [Elusimicrobiota bacterium]